MEPAMNHSIYTADRATHLKVVVAVLLASIAIMATTLGAKIAHSDTNGQAMATQTIYKPRPGNSLTQMTQAEKRPI
jgi:cell division protein FtsN